METGLPWGHTRGSLSSPSSLERNNTRPAAAQKKKKNDEIPPELRDEALLFLQGLESNPEASLKTPQEA